MSIVPGDVRPHVPTFRISCNGAALQATSSLVTLDTSHAADGPGTATLRFAVSPAEGGLDHVFVTAPLDAVLVVALGYRDDVHPVFSGTVRAHRLELASAGLPGVVLEATSSFAPADPSDDVATTAQYGATLMSLEIERAFADPDVAADRHPVVQGHATLVGTTQVKPGGLLRLSGTGETFDGPLRITDVQHRLTREGWTTRVGVRVERGHA